MVSTSVANVQQVGLDMGQGPAKALNARGRLQPLEVFAALLLTFRPPGAFQPCDLSSGLFTSSVALARQRKSCFHHVAAVRMREAEDAFQDIGKDDPKYDESEVDPNYDPSEERPVDPDALKYDESEVDPNYDPQKYNPDDPIYQDWLWLNSSDVQYGDGFRGAGDGYLSVYKRSEKQTKAVLLLHTAAAASSEELLRKFADKLALECNCPVLAPYLRGGPEHWAPPSRFAGEFWSATMYLNRECSAESLAAVAIGHSATVSMLTFLSQDSIGAHAAVAFCPGGATANLGDLARAARDVSVPFAALCGPDADGQACAQALRESLSLNSRLGPHYYVYNIKEASSDDPLPSLVHGNYSIEPLSLSATFIERYAPSGLTPA